MLLWVLGTALAQTTGGWLGVQGSLVDDNVPWTTRSALGVHASIRPGEWVGVDLSGDFAPDLDGGAQWTSHVWRLDPEPDPASKLIWHTGAVARLTPFRGSVGTERNQRPIALYGLLGAGLVGTADDLTVIQAEGDPEAEADANQVHPTFEAGVGGSLQVDWLAFELEGRHLGYREQIDGADLKERNWLGALRIAARL